MAEAKKQSAFMRWYSSYSGKNAVNVVYSLGASVVIIGALFKIMHWPGAGIVLTAGMCTEAFLFVIGVLEHPHEEFHWANVFPQLLEYGAPEDRLAKAQAQPVPTLLGSGAAGTGANAVNVPSLSDKDMEALKKGINDLAQTAGQLSEIGKVAAATSKLTEKAEAAAEAADKYATTATALGEKSAQLVASYTTVATDMQNAINGTKTYQQNIEAVGAKLGSINSLYELQVNAIQSQVEAYKAQTSAVAEVTKGVENMKAVVAQSLQDQQAYGEGAKKLAAQIADLNKVYGNMLTALA